MVFITRAKHYSIFAVLAGVVLVGAACQRQSSPAPSPAPAPVGEESTEGRMEGGTGGAAVPGAAMPVPGSDVPEMVVVKTFEVTAKNFEFGMKEIRVKKGDTVNVVLKNEQGFHDWVVDEFNARTAQAQAPSAAEVEFVADKAGTFEYYCSVGQHRQMGMKGNLVVE